MKAKGIAATGHELTAAAAELILREGGNAFDAVAAGLCAACVVEPVLTSFGGGGYLLAHTADHQSRVYDFFVQTPKARRPEAELNFYPVLADFGEAQQEFHIGMGSVATPGLVRGLFAIQAELGSMPIRDIVSPAIEYARDGVRLNSFQAYTLRVVSPIFRATADARAIYCTDDAEQRLLDEGELLRQADLADALEVLAIEGEDLFYRGEMGQRLVRGCREGGGCLTMDDLEQYTVEHRRPLELAYRQTRLLTNPPPSAGGILIAFALKILEAVPDLAGLRHGSRRQLALMAAVMELTNKARVDAHAEAGGPGLERLLDEELLQRYRTEVLGRAQSIRGTTQLSVMDAKGNVATMSLSNGSASGQVIPGTGIMLNNMLGEEDLTPGGWHHWPVDRRMTSMMSPSVARFPDGRTIATGSGGSKRIRTAILQVLVNMIDYGMGVEEAVASPRLFLENDLLSVEGGFDDDEVRELAREHPRHEIWEELNLFFGGAHTVERIGNAFHGAGDPRRGGVSVVVT